MGEHQIFFNVFTVFFVHRSGPLDLLTFGFLIFFCFPRDRQCNSFAPLKG